jgi:hypothetical protein
MPNLRLCSTFLLAAILGGCQQASVGGSTPQNGGNDAAPASFAPTVAAAPAGTAVGARAQELRGQAQQLNTTIDQHLAQLRQIRQERDAVADQYYAAVGEISARLHVGTTPSNPIMMAKWTEARGLLDKLEGNLSQVTALSNDMAVDGQTGDYLENSTRAVFVMPGAVDEDHAQLRALEEAVGASESKVSGELIEVTNEINRQNAALGIERNNLSTLAEGVRAGQYLGHSLANPPVRPAGKGAGAPAKAAPAAATPHGGPGHHHHGDKGKAKTPAAAPALDQPAQNAAPAQPADATPATDAPNPAAPAVETTPLPAPAPTKPHDKRSVKPAHGTTAALPRDGHGALMVIRIDQYDQRYQEALYGAVSKALQRQPNAKFRIVGVTPEAGRPEDTALRLGDVRRHVEDVERSLLAFGVNGTQISTVSAADKRAPVEEIRVYKQ